MTRIFVLQGANLNWLGLREPEKYGTTTAVELDEMIRRHAEERGFDVEILYCNGEGQAIDALYAAAGRGVDAIVMNPGGFSYAGYALRDCVLAIEMPVIDVHLTNHYTRDIHCVTSAAAKGVIMGLGIGGYFLALDAALNLVRAK